MNIPKAIARYLILPSVLAVIFISFPQDIYSRISARGRILYNRQPVADVKIVIIEIKKGTKSNENGYFDINVPSPGYYTFRIYHGQNLFVQRKAVRYQTQTIFFYIASQKTGEIAGVDDVIQIIGFKDKSKLSHHRFSKGEIKRLPGVYGDSLKAINTLPGIFPVQPIGVAPGISFGPAGSFQNFGIGPPYSNSTNGFLVMRGGGPLANSFYLDGFKMMYPYHLGDQSSVLNNDFIQSIDVYTGSFPAKYGNATGGVIAIEGPEKIETSGGHINVSLFQSDLYYQQPIFEKKGFIVAAVRKNYPNYTMLRLYPDSVPVNAKYADYHDAQVKFGMRFDNNNEITIIHFSSQDVYGYTKAVDEATNDHYAGNDLISVLIDRPPIGIDRGFSTQGFSYTFRLGGVIENEFYVQMNRFAEDFEIEFKDPFTGETIFGFEIVNARHEIQYKNEFRFEMIRKHAIVKLGFEQSNNTWELSMTNLTPRETLNENTADFVDSINLAIENNRTFRALWDGDLTRFNLNAAYAEIELEFWNFRIVPGIRSEYFSLSKTTGTGPRMNIEYAFKEIGTTLLMGAGRHFNLPPTLDQISIESGNPNLGMEESEHMAMGIEQKIGNNWIVKAELFRNLFKNIVVADEFIVDPLALRTNKRDLIEKTAEIKQDPFENDPLIYSNDGTGHSSGFELFLKKTRKPGRNGFFGWLSYTRSLTKRNNHQPRLTEDERNDMEFRNKNRKVLAQFEIRKNTINYYDNRELEIYYDNDREELYDLDRTDQINLVLNYKFNVRWQLGIRWRYATATPYTPIVGDEQPLLPILNRPFFLPEYSENYNSARLGPFHQLDIRLDYFMRYSWGYAGYYIELINFYARKNPEQENFDVFYPYVRGVNPAVSYSATYYETGTGSGKSVLWPLINVGMEIRF